MKALYELQSIIQTVLIDIVRNAWRCVKMGAGHPSPHLTSPRVRVNITWLLAGRANPSRGSCLDRDNTRHRVKESPQQLWWLGTESLDGTYAGQCRQQLWQRPVATVPVAVSETEAACGAILAVPHLAWNLLKSGSPTFPWILFALICRGHFYFHNLKILINMHTITEKIQSLNPKSWSRFNIQIASDRFLHIYLVCWLKPKIIRYF